jgi:hypothetical protein
MVTLALAVLQIGGMLDAVSTVMLAVLTGLFLSSVLFGTGWWKRFWYYRVSRWFDPLRQIHWFLPALVVGVLLTVADFVVARAGSGLPTLLLWFVLAGYAIWLFCKKRVLNWLHRSQLRDAVDDGGGFPMNILATDGSVGLFDNWGGVARILPYSILILGATRSGKTEVAKHRVYQMLGDLLAPIVVFDYKRDYQEFFDLLGIPYTRISLEDSSDIWNVFLEFEDELDIDEFARALFPEPSGDNSSSDHFEEMARQAFAAVLKMLVREAGGVEELSNHTIRHYFQTSGPGDVYEDLSEYPDFRASQSALNVETNAKHAQDVFITMQRTVNKVFVGDFARSPEGLGFTIRGYMENQQPAPLVLDFPKDKGATTEPLFRFMIDWAARFALNDPDRQHYFVLDEFARIPHLRKIGDLLNVGSGDGVQVLVTLQSVTQMYYNYGRDRGESLLSGLVTKVCLRANDSETVDFIRDSIGTEFVEYTKHVDYRQSLISDRRVETNRETKQEEEHAFAKGDIQKWSQGWGVVVTPDGWMFGYIPMLHDEDARVYDSVVEDVEQPELESGSDESGSSGRLTEVVSGD